MSTLLPAYPRLCGGNDSYCPRDLPMSGPSPPARGKRFAAIENVAEPRSIPACAGETLESGGVVPVTAVYPRLRGGNVATLQAT